MASGEKKTDRKKYSPLAAKKVKQAVHEMKRGELKSGRSEKKVTSREQAIAIGLSEARERGARVPKQKQKRKQKRSDRGRESARRRSA